MSHNNDCVIINAIGQNVNLEPLKGYCIDSFLQEYDTSSGSSGHEFKFKTLFSGQEIDLNIKDNTFKVLRSNLVIGELFEFKGYGVLKVVRCEIPKKRFSKNVLLDVNEVQRVVHTPEIKIENLTDEDSRLPQKIQTIMPPKTEHVLPSIKNKIVIPG